MNNVWERNEWVEETEQWMKYEKLMVREGNESVMENEPLEYEKEMNEEWEIN